MIVKSEQTKKNSSLVVKGTSKTFKWNIHSEGVVEGHAFTLPFINEYKGNRLTAVEYYWYSRNGTNRIRRGIQVSGHGIYGVPTLRENDVLIALQNIFFAKKTKNGICELETDPSKITDDYLAIQFTITELAREMGIEVPNALIRKNLKESIEILMATSFYSVNEGIYDIGEKKYVADEKIGYHFLEEMQTFQVSERDDENDEVAISSSMGVEAITEVKKTYDITRVRLSKFIYFSFVNNFKYYYNKNILYKTKNRMAKKIYQLALAWKGDNTFSFTTIDTLVDRIPIIQNEEMSKKDKSYERHRKQYIKRAIKILNECGMVKVKYDDENPDKVYFIFDEGLTDIDTKENLLDKYNSFTEIKEGFKQIGFNETETEELFDIEKIRYIQALLRYIVIRMQYDTINNPIKLFKSYLANQFPLDKKYYNKDVRESLTQS